MSRGHKFQKLTLAPLRSDANAIAEVPLTVQGASGQTGDLLQIKNSAGTVLAGFTAAGLPLLTDAAIGLGLLRVAHAKYSFAVDGGVVGAITPVSTAVIPNKAILLGAVINSTTAVVGASSTLAVGTTAGSAANSIKTATAEATLTTNALVNGTVTFAAPVKMTAAGSINVTVGTANLTAGVVEIFVLYVVSGT